MKFFTVLFVIIGLLYAGYKLKYPTVSWHQKLTLVVETPNGPITGSSVGAVVVAFSPKILPQGAGIKRSFQGEATVVDLGDGRYLFALIDKATSRIHVVQYETDRAAMKSRTSKQNYRRIPGLDTPLSVPMSVMPLLVTFGDIDDPASVMRVDPADLAATFGPGFALREVTLEVTDEPVTEGVVEGVLGWLHGYSEWIVPRDGTLLDTSDPLVPIGSVDFSTEVFK